MDEPAVVPEHEESYARKSFLLLCKPSWLSGFLCVILAVAVIAAIVIISQYKGSAVQQEFLAWRTASTSQSYDAAYAAEYNSTPFQTATNTVFTFVFWCFVGLFVYFLLYGVYDVFYNAETFKQELHYVNSSRTQLLREALTRVGVRLLVLGVWAAYVLAFLRAIVPYALAAAHIAAGKPLTLTGMGYMISALAVLFVSLHVHVVLLRLVLLRPRVFHSEAYL